VRFAEPGDLSAFEEMLRTYLKEQEASSPVRLTRKTVDWYRNLAHSYLKGSLFGTLVLGEVESEVGPQVVGFALAGEDLGQPRVDTTLGKVAVVWLVWVAPEHRKSLAALGMLLFGRPKLLELGFETAVMDVRENNPEGKALTLAFGAHPEEMVYHFPLKEEPRGQRPA